MAKKCLFLKIFGEVQGVGFRYYASEVAQRLGLFGWIKNVNDGTVECVVEGEEENLKNFLQWAQSGPQWAKVERVEEKWEEFKDEFSGFEIKF